MRTLFLVVARGGSKGVPGKNLTRIGRLSLVAYKVIGALNAECCTRLIVSSDSEAIEDEARAYGAEVLFRRPGELATDAAPITGAISHAMDWVERNTTERFDSLMLLEPSSPFTRPRDYEAAVELMEARDADVVVGVKPVSVASLFIGQLGPQGELSPILAKMGSHAGLRRQEVGQEYTMNGGLYLLRWESYRRNPTVYGHRAIYGYVMDPRYSVEIDTPDDLAWAEFLVARGDVDLSSWHADGM